MADAEGARRLVLMLSVSRLWRDQRAVAIPMTAITFAVLLAFAGLVLDGGLIYFEKRRMQFAADAGSYGGALELFRGNTALIEQGARNDARLNGYEHGEGTIDVAVNHPPTSGPHQNNQHVEVIVTEQVPTYFMKVFNMGDVTVRARAVSGVAEDTSPACVIALDPNSSPGLVINGNATLRAPECRIQVNSGGGDGLRVNGGSSDPCLEGTMVGVSGGFFGNEACVHGELTEGTAPLWDPYYPNTLDPITMTMTGDSIEQQIADALLTMPTYSLPKVSGGDNYCDGNAIPPGYYQGGIDVVGGCLELQTGLYVVDGFRVNGGTVKGGPPAGSGLGGGVTIYNTAQGHGPLRAVRMNGNGQIFLTATNAAAGDAHCCDGFLFINSRSAGSSQPYDGFVCGTADSEVEGKLYFPTVQLDFCGTSQSNAWLEMVGDTIRVSGTADVFGGSERAGGTGPGKFKISLVE